MKNQKSDKTGTSIINVQFSKKEYEEISKAARQQGITFNEAVVRAIDMFLKK
jgi:predicted HicB family RNase H-like nuclease